MRGHDFRKQLLYEGVFAVSNQLLEAGMESIIVLFQETILRNTGKMGWSNERKKREEVKEEQEGVGI